MYMTEVKRKDLKIHYRNRSSTGILINDYERTDMDLMPIAKLLYKVNLSNL